MIAGIAGGTIVGQARGIRPAPARIRLQILGRLGQIAGQLAVSLRGWRTLAWLVVWTGGCALFGVAAAEFGHGGNVVPVGLAAGLFSGLGTWFVVSFVRALGTGFPWVPEWSKTWGPDRRSTSRGCPGRARRSP
ncbi:hypothetical protein [Amycolatopsis mediterranei]|uniref:hypothetical protein n=1 Tax=Amycolatopsis mediterranei TaxID=33910 RepID=UPI0033208109